MTRIYRPQPFHISQRVSFTVTAVKVSSRSDGRGLDICHIQPIDISNIGEKKLSGAAEIKSSF